MIQALADRHRPEQFEEVVGQNAAITSLRGVIERGDSQQFLFTGPSGVGKTTLAKIVAAEMGVLPRDVMSFSAAEKSGVDDMRAVLETARYSPFGEGMVRAIIVDEAQGLSKQAWDSLLTATEQPPEHVVWFLCSTNEAKIPATIKTRFTRFALKEVSEADLLKLLQRVCKVESIKLPDAIDLLIIREALGSPRQMLTNLALCRDLKSVKMAAEVLRTALESDATRELCQFLLRPGSWTKAMGVVERITDEPEGVRIIVCNYLGACLRNAKSDTDAIRFLGILENWSTPYNASENNAPLMLSLGRSLFSGG